MSIPSPHRGPFRNSAFEMKLLARGGYETSSGFTFEFGPDTRLPRTWITYDDAEGVSVRLEASSVRRATIPNPGEGDSKHAYSQMREYELERLATQLLSELYHGMEDIESSTRSARKKLSTKLSTIARERIEDQAKFNTHDLERELSLSEYEGAIGSQAGVISYWTEEGLKLRNGKKVKIQVEFTPSEAYFGSRWTAPNLIVEQSSKAGKLLVVIPSTVHREINDWESADPAPDTVANTEGSKSSFFVIGSGNRLRQRFSKDLVNNLSQVCTTLDTDNLEEASKILQNAHRTFVHENFKPHLHGSATKNQADAGWDERHPFLWTPNDSQLEVEFAGRIEDVGTQGLRSLKKLKSTERSSKPQVPSGPHDVYRPLSSSVTPYGNETLEKVAADTKLLCGDGSGGKGSRQSVTTNEQVTPRSQPPQ